MVASAARATAGSRTSVQKIARHDPSARIWLPASGATSGAAATMVMSVDITCAAFSPW